jgi:hypothetical protein
MSFCPVILVNAEKYSLVSIVQCLRKTAKCSEEGWFLLTLPQRVQLAICPPKHAMSTPRDCILDMRLDVT